MQSSPAYRREKAESRERPGNPGTPASKGSKGTKLKKVDNIMCKYILIVLMTCQGVSFTIVL